VHLHRERGGPVIAVEPVTSRDLVDPLAELWFETELRAGAEVRSLAEVRARATLVWREDAKIGRYAAGFELVRCDGPDGASTRYFPRESLGHVASRKAMELIAEGVLAAGDRYYYGLEAGDLEAMVRGPEGALAPRFAPLPLAPLLEKAESREMLPEDRDYPVLFTRHAHARAERISRAGGAQRPPVESGGLLVGPLCRCPDTGEVFAVIVDVIDAAGSEATKYSLTFSGETWSRIQTILRARRSQPASRYHVLTGSTHGHNFAPFEGADPCEACALVEVCTRSSAHLSSDDRTWSRAVFHATPWQLSQVFGHDARMGHSEAFYGQRQGALERRGYWLIDAFDEERLA
jgi:hypothetical protein